MYHFVPKTGFGVQKDGSKIHYFDYEASFHNRSKDFYDQDIQAAIDANDIHRLSNLLVAAFSDLVLDGNSDMTSYMYLMDKSRFALSDAVKNEIGEDLAKDGGVALGLVTELVSTSSSAEGLFKRAVLTRGEMDDLKGLEALNESYIRKVYAAVTPMVETKGILLNNGVDISQGWGKDLAEKAPTVDRLVNMNFLEFQNVLPSSRSDANTSSLSDLKAPVGEELVAYQMYAGMLGSALQNNPVPPIRGYILENGLHPQVAYEMEKVSENV